MKQIVGSTLGGADDSDVSTNHVSTETAGAHARRYASAGLTGGHVIMLDRSPATRAAAKEALQAAPGTLQVGGGITAADAREWIDAGAAAVVVTSAAFKAGKLDLEELEQLAEALGDKNKLVIDLSARRMRIGEEEASGAGEASKASREVPAGLPGTAVQPSQLFQGASTASDALSYLYVVVADRWATWTDLALTPASLTRLGALCGELLVHAVDIEGLCRGPDLALARLLGENAPVPVTYAGGVRNIDDLKDVAREGKGKVDVTVGSALDIFGGSLPYLDVLKWHRGEL